MSFILDWVLGTVLDKSADWAIEKGFSRQLPQHLDDAAIAWSESLPHTLKLDPHALTLVLDNSQSSASRPAAAKLRSLISAGYVPIFEEWEAALIEQWLFVSQSNNALPFFRANIETVRPFLNDLSLRLHKSAAGNEQLARVNIVQRLEQLAELAKRTNEIVSRTNDLVVHSRFEGERIDADVITAKRAKEDFVSLVECIAKSAHDDDPWSRTIHDFGVQMGLGPTEQTKLVVQSLLSLGAVDLNAKQCEVIVIGAKSELDAYSGGLADPIRKVVDVPAGTLSASVMQAIQCTNSSTTVKCAIAGREDSLYTSELIAVLDALIEHFSHKSQLPVLVVVPFSFNWTSSGGLPGIMQEVFCDLVSCGIIPIVGKHWTQSHCVRVEPIVPPWLTTKLQPPTQQVPASTHAIRCPNWQNVLNTDGTSLIVTSTATAEGIAAGAVSRLAIENPTASAQEIVDTLSREDCSANGFFSLKIANQELKKRLL